MIGLNGTTKYMYMYSTCNICQAISECLGLTSGKALAYGTS